MAPPPHRLLLHDGTALDLGTRHIDCASIYGNEAAIGEALAACLRAGELNRDQLWITSKLWNDCHAPEQVRPALERTLGDLGLDHLDLYLIHWPVAHRHGVLIPERAEDQISLEQQPLADTWGAMENLAAAELRLDEAELAAIAALDRHHRFIEGRFWTLPGGPTTLANLWDETTPSP